MASEMTSSIGFLPFFFEFSTPDSDPNSPPDRILLFNPIMFSSASDSSGGVPPASKKSIEAMKSVSVAEDGAECSVCLDEFEKGMEAKEMTCGHRFHGNCIEKWLRINGSCPVCRYRMPEEEMGEREKEGEEGRTREVRVTIVIGRPEGMTRTEIMADDLD